MFRLIALLCLLPLAWLFDTDGGGDGGSGEGDGAGDGQAGGGDDAPDLKYSDADLDKYKGSARVEGRTGAINELLSKAQGAQSVDDLIAAWQEKQTTEDAAKTETERERDAREKAEAREKALKEELTNERIGFRLEAAMRDAGVPADRLEDSLVIARGSKEYSALTFEDGKVQGLDALVTATLDPRPWLKEEQQGQGQQRRSAIDTSRSQTPTEEVEPGLARLRRAYG